MNGFISFLLSDDERANALRQAYLFVIVPMLNPDGVSRGHYRTDAFGCDLNRSYGSEDQSKHPSTFAVTKVN
jgi:murein tripeptide amidase MpaA